MTGPHPEAWELLDQVADPCSIATGAPVSIVELGIVHDIEIEDGRAVVSFLLTSPVCMQVGNICEQAEKKLASLADVDSVEFVVGSHEVWTPSMMDPAARERQRRIRPGELIEGEDGSVVTRGDLLDRWFAQYETADA